MALTQDTQLIDIQGLVVETFKTTLGTDEVIVGNEKVVYAEILPDSTIKEYVEPTIQFTKWNKEESLTLSYPDTLFSDKTLVDGELKLSARNEEFYFRQHDSDTMKFGLILNQIPDKSKIVTIDGIEYYQWQFKLVGWENFDFFYQPPLTAEFKVGDEDGQIVNVTETDCFDKDGKSITHRPIEVVGSYAVYHKTKANYIIGQTNYMTGKFCHIYKPRFIDTNGDIQWAILDIKDDIYKISVLKVWIDKAIYPIKANDTFGLITKGQTNSPTHANNYIFGSFATTSIGISGILSKLSIYAQRASSDGNISLAIYNDNGNSPSGATKLDSGTQITTIPTSEGWIDSTGLTQSINGNTIYWLSADTSVQVSLWYDSADPNTSYYISLTYINPLPVTHPTGPGFESIKWSIYATYTPSGEVTPYGYLSTNKGFW